VTFKDTKFVNVINGLTVLTQILPLYYLNVYTTVWLLW